MRLASIWSTSCNIQLLSQQQSTRNTMVNDPKKNLSLLLAGTYGISIKHFTRRYHQAKEGKSRLEAEGVRALGVLRSLRSKKKLPAEKKWETHFLSFKEKEQWTEDYVERMTAVAIKRVQDGERAIKQNREDMSRVEKAGLTTRKPKKTFEEMLNAIGGSMNDCASSNHVKYAEDQEDDKDTEQGKLSEDDEPGWVMGTISNTVQCRMERFWQKQMKLEKLWQPGKGEAPDYFPERDMKNGMTILLVPAVVRSQTDQVAAAPPLITFG